MMKTFKLTHIIMMLGVLCCSISCSSDNSDDGDDTSSGTLNSLEAILTAFNNGDFTGVDYRSTENRNILNQRILSMEIQNGNSTADFRQLEILTRPEESPVDLNPTRLLLTEDDDAFGTVVDGIRMSLWAETEIRNNNEVVSGFTPFAFIITSDINSGSLVLLDGTLTVNFTP